MSVEANSFLLVINGQIETVECPHFDDIYCRFNFFYGEDWEIASGLEEGISQISKKSDDERQLFVFNFPLDVCFRSSTPFGWPKIVMHVYGHDVFGNDVIRGYGVAHLPAITGRRTITMPLYIPEASSRLQQFVGWLTGRRPELADPRVLASGEGREVTKMRTQGKATLTFHTLSQNFVDMGYCNQQKT